MFASIDESTPDGVAGCDGFDRIEDVTDVEDPDDLDELYPDVDANGDPAGGPETGPIVDLSVGVGARLALQAQCASAVPDVLARTEVLDTVEAFGLTARWVAGGRIRMLAEFAARHPADSRSAPPGADESGMVPSRQWLPSEIALTEGISRLEAVGEIAQAERFTQVLPDTLALLEAGQIDLRRAQAIARATAVLPDGKAREVEAKVLPKAPGATLRQLQDRVRRAIARVDPDGEYRRHREADTGRRVSITSLEDGMASLWFYGSAAEIEEAWQVADRMARSLSADDPRTLDQRRFDLAIQTLQGRITVVAESDVDTAVTDILTRLDTSEPVETAETAEGGAGRTSEAGGAGGAEPADGGTETGECGRETTESADGTDGTDGTGNGSSDGIDGTRPTGESEDDQDGVPGSETETGPGSGRGAKSDSGAGSGAASEDPDQDHDRGPAACASDHDNGSADRTPPGPAPGARPGAQPDARAGAPPDAGVGAGAPPMITPERLTAAVADVLARRPDMAAAVGRKPLIQVVVSIDTLRGGQGSAELVGHGPIDADTARELAADGIWMRLTTDPLSGTLLDVGRHCYTPPAALDRHVRARDLTCRGPQCGRRIRDLDHHQEWTRDGGPTAEPNLYGYCQYHHKLKDTPGWQVIAHADRSLTWISPCGRTYRTEPFDYRPFTDPPAAPSSPTPATVDMTAPIDATDTTPPPF